MPTAPQTEEGWYALHDFRTIDWDAWQAASEHERERALESGVDFLEAHESLADVAGNEGGSAAFAIMGHKADLMILHLRETTAAIETAERAFERTPFARFTEQTASFVSVTEVSGYMSQEYFEGEEVADSGTARYIESRIRPQIPVAEHVCFYPMDKRRGPEHNWYDLPFDDRADLMSNHGDIGRRYAGKVTQIITSSIGFDDHEWGITLFANDPTQIKRLLYEMRFDPSTSRYGEFGTFYFGRRFAPSALEPFMAGEQLSAYESESEPSTDVSETLDSLGISIGAPDDANPHAVVVEADTDRDTIANEIDGLRGNFEHYDSHIETEVHEGPTVVSLWTTERAAETAAGFLADCSGAAAPTIGGVSGATADTTPETAAPAEDVRESLDSLDIYAGQPHGEDVFALVVYSTAPIGDLTPAVADLSDGFDRYDTHQGTNCYHARHGDRSAVVSLWKTKSAADTAGEYLAELPQVVGRAGAPDDGFGTMGMFYTVKPDHRSAFVETFDEVEGLLAEMDGHRNTDVLINTADENDMFIASEWDSKEDAMSFFRSDAFSETVQWGRDVLADRPRHVFLA